MFLAFAQAIAALLATRKWADASDYLRPWSWNLRRLGELRKLRREVQKVRKVNDRAITRLMLGGTARLRTASDERVAETGSNEPGQSASVTWSPESVRAARRTRLRTMPSARRHAAA